MDKLLVAVVGNRNAGKSHTWNTLFGRKVRTGVRPRSLTLFSNAETDVFLVSGSPQERKKEIDEILKGQHPRIVLCSVQYTPDGLETIRFFQQHGYFLFVHWLNPGRSDASVAPDRLSLVKTALLTPSLIGIRDGKLLAAPRIEEIRQFIHGWAAGRCLVRRPRIASLNYALQPPASAQAQAVP